MALSNASNDDLLGCIVRVFFYEQSAKALCNDDGSSAGSPSSQPQTAHYLGLHCFRLAYFSLVCRYVNNTRWTCPVPHHMSGTQLLHRGETHGLIRLVGSLPLFMLRWTCVCVCPLRYRVQPPTQAPATNHPPPGNQTSPHIYCTDH